MKRSYLNSNKIKNILYNRAVYFNGIPYTMYFKVNNINGCICIEFDKTNSFANLAFTNDSVNRIDRIKAKSIDNQIECAIKYIDDSGLAHQFAIYFASYAYKSFMKGVIPSPFIITG